MKIIVCYVLLIYYTRYSLISFRVTLVSWNAYYRMLKFSLSRTSNYILFHLWDIKYQSIDTNIMEHLEIVATFANLSGDGWSLHFNDFHFTGLMEAFIQFVSHFRSATHWCVPKMFLKILERIELINSHNVLKNFVTTTYHCVSVHLFPLFWWWLSQDYLCFCKTSIMVFFAKTVPK